MKLVNATKTCLRKYATFSGRASRPEYWYFVLAFFLGSIFLAMIDSALFGTQALETELSETRAAFSYQSNGPLSSLFSLATLLPLLAAGWRRMHDSGRSGLHLIYPIIAIFGTLSFGGMTGLFEDGAEISGVLSAIFFACLIVAAISPLIVIYWLIRPTQPGHNTYGPEPVRIEA